MQLEKDAKKNFPWRACLIFLILASAAAYLVLNREAPKEEKDHKKGGKDSTVSVENVTLGDMPIYLRGLGTVTALRTVTVKSRVEGELLRVHYQEGGIVKSGDLLAEIDPRSFDIQVMQAQGQLQRDEALLKNAQLDLQRYKTLLAQDSIAAQQVATQESLVKQYQGTVATDKAAVANAKLQQSYTKITAPISGRLGLRLVDQGNIIKASDTQGLAVITQIQPISVVFTLPEDALPTLNTHQKQTLVVEAFDRS
ncbi:partial Multidrug resistance protein MdtA, partial [uncultured bacterium]